MPAVWTVPFPPNPHFTGRADVLDELHHRLAEKPAPAVAQPQAIHGLGGVGKTQLTVEYAWKYRSDYGAVLWVVADSAENAAANLAVLSNSNVLNLPEATVTEQAAQTAAVLRWLRQDARWLLIFDSADTEEAARSVLGFLSSIAPSGHVIITSRLSDWPVTVSDIAVDSLRDASAADFLIARTARPGFEPGSRGEAIELAQELGGLPLALEQSAAYVLRHRNTFADYLGMLKTARRELLQQKAEGGTRYPKSVAETWLVTEQRLGPTARAILRLAAFLAPDNIPRSLFAGEGEVLEEATRALTTESGRGSVRSSEVETALVELADHSLITLAPKTFSCHRLVQAIQCNRLTHEASRQWTRLALKLVNDFATGDPHDVWTWPFGESLRAHAEVVTHHADSHGIIEPTASLMDKVGLFLLAKALYLEAEPLIGRALAIRVRDLGPDHPTVAHSLCNLSDLLHATNRLEDAELLGRSALRIYEQSSGSHHSKMVRALSNLAHLLQDTNRLAEAESLWRRALVIGEKHPDTAPIAMVVILDGLAQVLHSRAQLTEAEPLMRRALAIGEQSLGLSHPDVAITLDNLAELLQATDRLEEAERLRRRALAIQEHSLGSEHPEIAVTLNNLAHLLLATNRLEEAEPLMRRSLAIRERSLGPDHPKVAIALCSLAQLLLTTDRPESAEPLVRRALTISEQSLGPDHPQVATSLDTLAQLLQTEKRLEEAEPLLRQALAIQKRAFGSDHPDVATALNNLARLLLAMNRAREAEPLARRALTIFEQSLGRNSPEAAVCLYNLIKAKWAMNKPRKTELLMRRVVSILHSSSVKAGHEHPDMREAVEDYERLLSAIGLTPLQIEQRVEEITKK